MRKKQKKIKDLLINTAAYIIIILIMVAIVMALLGFISFIGFLITWESARTGLLLAGGMAIILMLIQEFGKED